MPRRCITDARLPSLIRAQDRLIHRRQALQLGLTRRAIGYRLSSGRWQLLLPDVYLTHPGQPSRRQLLVAALLYAGPRSAIDARDACWFHGVRAVPVDEDRVHLVEPWGEPARSISFVTIRRTVAPIRIVSTDLLRYLEPAAAVVATARRLRTERAVLGLLSDALQRGVVTYDELVCAHVQGPRKNVALTDAALAQLGGGARSAPEVDFLKLVRASRMLPEPICNGLLRLPAGRLISPDALFVASGVVHETNGRTAHRREDLFEDMQERHDAMTAAGLTVLHNSPRRLRLYGREVIAEVERCHLRRAGAGLPDGVELVRLAA